MELSRAIWTLGGDTVMLGWFAWQTQRYQNGGEGKVKVWATGTTASRASKNLLKHKALQEKHRLIQAELDAQRPFKPRFEEDAAIFEDLVI